jgi:hypothetical protein
MADRSTDHSMEDVEQSAGAVDKGKGKAQDTVEESGDDSSDESGVEDHVIILPSYTRWHKLLTSDNRPLVRRNPLHRNILRLLTCEAAEPEEDDNDNMEEIDPSNIIGSRTRGKNIDFTKANAELGEDEDEEDDEDFVEPGGDDAMEE